MSEHPIQGLMTTAMDSLKEMIDVNTIVGDPVETPDGSVILTVSKVGFGFAAGGTEFGEAGQESGNHPFGGGSGGGVSITPIAFLIVNSQGVKIVHLDESTHLFERILETAPQAVDKVQQMIAKNAGGKDKEKEKDKDKDKDKDKGKDQGKQKDKSGEEEYDF